jgi:competence ComEA-like helix-hairpin-helix protein
VRQKLFLTLFLFAAVRRSPAQDEPDALPNGKGKDAVKKVCTGCHELDTVVGARRTRIGWQRNVQDMAARGAEGSDDEMEAIVEYLTAFFGKINVNTASAKDLETALGLSAAEARAIVAYRGQNGDFKNFEQFEKTPGVKVEKLAAKRSQIAFSR